MKISKLFHWLYGFVMFLPIFAIGGALLISTFNMSAKTETNIVYKYETNEVNTRNDLIKGNIYHFSTNEFEYYNYDNVGSISFYFINIQKNDSFQGELDEDYVWNITHNGDFIALYDSEWEVIYFYWGEDTYFSYSINGNQNFTIEGDIVIGEESDIGQISSTHLQDFTPCTNIPIESAETTNLDSQEVFYNAVDKVTESSLFSWAYDSFLVAPFTYIVALFGMPTNHVVVELLSYWLSISIIWLVFDLVMYVPLLVHRWLDKGVLE